MAHPFGAGLRLIRPPGCLTAAADSVTAALVVSAASGRAASLAAVTAVGVASFAIYAFGIVVGDLRDVEKDRLRHPDRPLPSGAVSSSRARGIALVMILVGLGAAGAVGWPAFLLAGLTASAVLAHLLVLKRRDGTASLGMASCRVLNLLLGASAAGSWTALPPLVAAATGLYVLALTGISAFEDRPGSRAVFSVLVVLLLTAILLPFPAFQQRGFPLVTAAPLFLILLRRGARARIRRRPDDVAALVGRSVTGILLLDAAYLFGFGHAPAAVAMIVLNLLVRLVLAPSLST